MRNESGAFVLKAVLLTLVMTAFSYATSIDLCTHLLKRTSFGVTTMELEKCLADKNYGASVNRIVDEATRIEPIPVPKCARTIIRPRVKVPMLSAEERKKFFRRKRGAGNELKEWWFDRLVKCDNPFAEKMTLFWHNHFTSSLRKVGQPKPMFRQNMLLRKHSLGDFSKMLHAIVKDPAMLIYLDNRSNRKSHPNENLARELLELFTLGEGHYGEGDIHAMARALSGYGVNRNLDFIFRKRWHDDGVKSFLGKSGKFDADDLIDIILTQKRCSIFIVEKLWREFVNPHPDPKETKRLAKIFRNSGYRISTLMKAMLKSPFFTDPNNRATLIKSPVDMTVGTMRSLEYHDFDTKTALRLLRMMGQDIMDPPSVKGWEGGKSWIDTNTLLTRHGFLRRVLRGYRGYMSSDGVKSVFERGSFADTPEERALKILLPQGVVMVPAEKFNRTLETILLHPLYQLK